MNVLVAGATGVIGRPLVTSLIRGEHQVHALVRDRGRADELRRAGAQPHVVDVFDRDEVVRAARAAEPEVVINHLTALPSDLDIRKYRAAMQPTDRLRGAPSEHLLQAAAIVGARRVVVQSQSFITAPEGPEIHDESARLYHDAPAQFRDAVAALAQMERDTLAAATLDPVVLRLGFLYGPGTYFALDLKAPRKDLSGSRKGHRRVVRRGDPASVHRHGYLTTARRVRRGARLFGVGDAAPARELALA